MIKISRPCLTLDELNRFLGRMKLSRERIILFGVLTLGLAALVADRFLLGSAGPTSASAAVQTPQVDVGTVPISESNAVDQRDLEPKGPSVAQQLRAAGDRRGLGLKVSRDAFVASAAWVGQESGPRAVGKGSDPAVSSADQFRSDHTLMAVMTRRGKALAIVDGKPIAIGHVLDDRFKLVAIHDRKAVFQSSSGPVVLELRKPELSP